VQNCLPQQKPQASLRDLCIMKVANVHTSDDHALLKDMNWLPTDLEEAIRLAIKQAADKGFTSPTAVCCSLIGLLHSHP
jgi:hypothetical protein